MALETDEKIPPKQEVEEKKEDTATTVDIGAKSSSTSNTNVPAAAGVNTDNAAKKKGLFGVWGLP